MVMMLTRRSRIASGCRSVFELIAVVAAGIERWTAVEEMAAAVSTGKVMKPVYRSPEQWFFMGSD